MSQSLSDNWIIGVRENGTQTAAADSLLQRLEELEASLERQKNEIATYKPATPVVGTTGNHTAYNLADDANNSGVILDQDSDSDMAEGTIQLNDSTDDT